MKKIILLVVGFLFAEYVYSQEIHTPTQILKILNDSKIGYQMGTFDKKIECKDYSDKLNDNNYYRLVKDSVIRTYGYSLNDKMKSLYGKAESFFAIHNLDSALRYYELILEEDSTLFQVMTYIGQVYEEKKDRDNAIKWYKRAISKNYIDYMAHWFLADMYYLTNNIEKAVDEITIAQILNRNNPRIKKSVAAIYSQAKRDTTDWCFNPQVEITKISDTKVKVAYSSVEWSMYATTKALWLYEPGYSEAMGVKQGQYSTIEDKEALISLVIGMENPKIKIQEDTQLRVLKEAAKNKNLDNYILYDIVLPKAPFLVYQLHEGAIIDIKNYILNFRNKK